MLTDEQIRELERLDYPFKEYDFVMRWSEFEFKYLGRHHRNSSMFRFYTQVMNGVLMFPVAEALDGR